MAFCTVFNIVRCLDHNGKHDDSSQDTKQKAVTALLRDKLQEQDFCETNIFTFLQNSWTSQSFSHCSDSASHEYASRASRSGLTVGFFSHPLQWPLCGPKISRRRRSTVAQMNSTLPHCNECLLWFRIFDFMETFPDFSRSLHHGIVVMCLIDAFACAHNHHRRKIVNSINTAEASRILETFGIA